MVYNMKMWPRKEGWEKHQKKSREQIIEDWELYSLINYYNGATQAMRMIVFLSYIYFNSFKSLTIVISFL